MDFLATRRDRSDGESVGGKAHRQSAPKARFSYSCAANRRYSAMMRPTVWPQEPPMKPNVPTPQALRALLDDAQARHADAPAAVAAALHALGPSLPADALGAEAIRLTEHVDLAHRADAAGLAGFLASLPPALAAADATRPSWQRAQWALAQVRGAVDDDGAPDLADVLRWRALQNVVLALAGQGRYREAGERLAADESAAQRHGTGEAGVAYAASANNVATELQTRGPRGDAGRDALMLQAAAIARRAWGVAGHWMHVERAEYRLALCHAVAGDGAAALRHAGLCLAGCVAAGEAADAAEHFFAHEALARAQLAAGEVYAAQREAQRMREWLPQISEADGLRAWCAQALADLPLPQPPHRP
jgi:hypothetical protein